MTKFFLLIFPLFTLCSVAKGDPLFVCPSQSSKEKRPLSFAKDFLSVEEFLRRTKPYRKERITVEFSPRQEETVEREKEVASVERETKKELLKYYLFLDGLSVGGMEIKGGCERRGKELTAKVGVRGSWPILESVRLFGDVYVGTGYQSYEETSRNKTWGDVRYFYLLAEPPYSGFRALVGRVPLVEERGFWFYNYVDGVRLEYRDSILSGFLFAGKRLGDSRISNTEERINLDGYAYLIGTLDYQYFYNHHLRFFFLREQRGDFGSSEVSVWSGVKEKESLNWVGLRLNGKFGRKRVRYYWLDVAYMWGKRGFAQVLEEECTAYKEVLSTSYRKVNGFGMEVGGKMVINNKGVGARVALGQGSNTPSEERAFYLPRLSTSREKLFGKNRVRYYGELANPDLNNLVIFSLFGGYRFLPKNWLEFNLLKYLRYDSSGGTSFSRYFVAPKSGSKDLGYEIDLMLDGELTTGKSRWRYLLTGSLFVAGGAFDGQLDRDKVYAVSLRLKRYW
ncbi:alginate export family protein [Phorcysia thermohydrogeniphila]|uniref:alginate export family protein n=1 Tax=Phorcysia thermohydrogeniphila TaxID=936138 RepID=UPI001FB55694|nr:alginate export family protein [Phorcysia thermohydrogeniphila]